MKLTWLSHASWLIEVGEHRVLLDPFFTDNPAAQAKPEDFTDVSHILVSHGHFDHIGDAADIAKRCGATVVTNFEIAQWLANQHGVTETLGMNIGGWVSLPFGRLQLTPAVHSSSLPDGSYGGSAGGFLLHALGMRIYFACDTALFSDMQLIAREELDVAVLPIGDLYTMGPEDSVEALKLLEATKVLPTHYNTWPPIEHDAEQWARLVREQTGAKPVVLKVGESMEL